MTDAVIAKPKRRAKPRKKAAEISVEEVRAKRWLCARNGAIFGAILEVPVLFLAQLPTFLRYDQQGASHLVVRLNSDFYAEMVGAMAMIAIIGGAMGYAVGKKENPVWWFVGVF